MRIQALFTLLILSLGSFTAQAGGPWVVKKNKGYVQLQAVLPVYPYRALLMGTIRDTQGVNRYTFNSDYSAYLEFGLTDRLNVVSTLPAKYIRTGRETDQRYFEDLLPAGSLFGLSNYHIGLKYQLVDRNVKAAVSVHSRWNTARFDLDKGLATGYDANAFGVMAHVGRGNDKHFGFVEVGYHAFTNGFSDVVQINVEHGWKLKEVWYLAATLNSTISLQNGTYYQANLAQTGFYPNNQAGTAISVKASRELNNGYGLQASFPLIPITLQYVGFNGTVAMGIYKRF
ncbi:MAG TPA: hypothetical protein DCE41_33490 [Cytophagales bacterium]|nr:hypothetical protein [Cytophagales bacterium]HAA20155.1 hypothetical protein [Cytophagales bacterium]HAP64326.1 hypothetical protein [Cytophagales bacterium]